jgi:triacylglycerol lipase
VKEVVGLNEREKLNGFDGHLALFLAAMSYQAYQIKERDKLILPKRYRLTSYIRTSNGEIFGYIAESSDTIVVAFRGTASLKNVSSYLDILQIPYPHAKSGGKTHRGITQIYQSCRTSFLDIIQTLSPAKRLIVTGHSLGGSLAALFALDAAINFPLQQPVLYMFAGLPIGDSDFVALFNEHVKNSIRVVNVNDNVPSINSRLAPFRYRKRIFSHQYVGQEFRLHFQKYRVTLNHTIVCFFHALGQMYGEFASEMRRMNPGFCPDTSGC